MMADLNARIPMTTVTKQITMHVQVTGVRVYAVRLWLAVQLFKLGAWIAGIGLHYEGPTE